MKLRIAFVVPGRFDAFDFHGALVADGHDVTLLTNYPKWAARRFGVAPRHVWSFWPHGVLTRIYDRARSRLPLPAATALSHRAFGLWACRRLRGEAWHVVHAFSGVAEEAFRELGPGRRGLRLLYRASAHIRVQDRLLAEEAERTAARIPRPIAWSVAREEREYALADRIRVPSTFARETFRQAGTAEEKLCLLPSAAPVEEFRPRREVVAERLRRLRRGERLRVLYVGALSWQKGMWDLARVMERMRGEDVDFRLVGPAHRDVLQHLEARGLAASAGGKLPQHELPQKAYSWGDVFIYPTVHDGFGMVVAQALASALPVLATRHCCAPDFVRGEENGWVVPARAPDALEERLRWCLGHRRELAAMVEAMAAGRSPVRAWSEAADDLATEYRRWRRRQEV